MISGYALRVLRNITSPAWILTTHCLAVIVGCSIEWTVTNKSFRRPEFFRAIDYTDTDNQNKETKHHIHRKHKTETGKKLH